MSEPEISVIIPVYNTEPEYLEACLRSLLCQCGSVSAEVIVVDDGSDNGCTGTLARCAENHPWLRVIRQENRGTSVARNTGLDAAGGKYVLFVDADDWVSRDCLSRILTRMEADPVDLLFFGYATAYTNREMRRVLPEEAAEGTGRFRNFWKKDTLEMSVLKGNPALGPVEIGAPWGKLIRRAVIEKAGLRYTPGLKKGQDTVFILELLEHCESFGYLPYPGYHYRMSSASVSRKYNPDIVNIMEKTLTAYGDFAWKYRKDPSFQDAVLDKYCRVLTGEYLELFFLHPENPASRKERMRSFYRLCRREPYRAAIEEAGRTASGLSGLGLRLIRHKWLRPFFDLKRLEYLLRDLLVRKYR